MLRRYLAREFSPCVCAVRTLVLVAVSTLVVGLLSGCERAKNAEETAALGTHHKAAEITALAWKKPTMRDLLSPSAKLSRALDLTEAQKFPDCHLIFEANHAPLTHSPLPAAPKRALVLAGCGPEAYRVADNGTHYIAYAVPAPRGEPGWDLRLTAYQKSGELAWAARMSRSENAQNFRANFRRSFIAPLLPRLICFGTLWQGGTQAECVDAQTGNPEWSGIMPFWSGAAPRGIKTSLVAAGLSGLTRRYPYSGVEMHFEKFMGTGGRSAFYAVAHDQLFFVPSASTQNKPNEAVMTAYRLDNFKPQWRLKLPDYPSSNWEYAFEKLGIALFKINDAIYAVDSRSGEALWGAQIGEGHPPVAANRGNLYLLLRRETAPNRLFELSPKTGKIHWFAPVPTGTLRLLSVEDSLILRSVRAVQRVKLSGSARPRTPKHLEATK